MFDFREGWSALSEKGRIQTGLLQLGIDRSELRVKIGAQAVHHRDNRKRDTRCDQTVFNRGRTRLIGQEFQKVALQVCLL
jgi:hypothetical protein